ncbi:hypothetical protein C0J52_13799 [Blattella germanica]|nr:hypothetical protein C0J52_13799 [Blattella germanica]
MINSLHGQQIGKAFTRIVHFRKILALQAVTASWPDNRTMNSLFWGRTWLVVVLTLRAVHLSTTGLLDWGLENESRCYDELGCLNVTREWYHLIYRPFNVFPLPREVINTRFVLYTRKNPSEGHVLRVQNEHTIRKSNFDAQKPTKFIIHGFIDTPLSNWVKDMRKELLKHADWNVIVVDWAGGSLPLYTQATANTRLVGLELAYFVNSLQKKPTDFHNLKHYSLLFHQPQRNFGLDPAAVHMIGHSLGAHTAGYAGERIAGLGRITGLDPAEPYFQGMPSFVRLDPSDAKFRNFGLDPAAVHMIGHSLGAHTAGYAGERIAGLGRITGLDPAEPYFQGMPSFVRLDPSDAKFVDVIHTDGKSIFLLGYGMRQPCGHVDFYPNNGKEQPGCDLTEAPLPLTLIREGIEEASRVLVACNHIRAIKLFIDSINSKCPYIARRCDSYQNFLQASLFASFVTKTSKGRCFSCHGANVSECAVMGLRADESVQVGENEVVPGGKFFITTGKDLPFCRHHYRVTVELAKPPKAENWVQGFMRISLQGDTGEIRNLDLTPSGYVRLQHGQSRSFVVAHPTDVEKIRKVEFYWEYDMDYLQPRSLCFLWCNDHLYVAKIHVEEMGMTSRGKRATSEMTSQLCSPGNREYAEIASKSSAAFYDNCP